MALLIAENNGCTVEDKKMKNVKEFIDKEMFIYADYDNQRMIPHMMDGLKISQRKVIHTATGIAADSIIKVSQLGMRAAEQTHYIHGEDSIIDTATGLAQDFPGSNNIPLLDKCEGQFGTSMNREASSPRYIYTRLSKEFHTIFKREDMKILEYLYEDGDKIEPRYFIPIVPMLLINGAKGVGNGYASSILQYNIKDVKQSLKEILKGQHTKNKLVPYLKGWKGDIKKLDSGQVVFTGSYKIVNTTTIEITELPPSMQLFQYKKHLNKLIEDKLIKDYENLSNEASWRFIIDVPRVVTSMDNEKLLSLFKLVERDTETFCCWNMQGKIQTFKTPEELVAEWLKNRLNLYQKSINFQISELYEEMEYNNARLKFILWWIDNSNKVKELSKSGIIKMVVAAEPELSNYIEKLIEIQVYRLCKDEVEKLRLKIKDLEQLLEVKEHETPQQVMLTDLESIK